jgi:hypothetical protein
MRKADLVFYGEVITATPPTHGDQKVTFRVVRPFKGVGDTRFTGAFRVTGQGVYFVAGERRVVYASAQGNGRWSTSCARTALVFRPADQEAADLAMCEGAETSPRHAGGKEGAAAPRRR